MLIKGGAGMSALLTMQAACLAAAEGKPFDAKQLKAAASTLGLIAEVPDAMRAFLVAARTYPELKDARFVAEVAQHVRMLTQVLNAAMPITDVLDAFPGATISAIENRMHRVLMDYAMGNWDGGAKAKLAIGKGYPAELSQFAMRMDAEGDVTPEEDAA